MYATERVTGITRPSQYVPRRLLRGPNGHADAGPSPQAAAIPGRTLEVDAGARARGGGVVQMRRFIGLVLASGVLLSISAVPAAPVPIVDQSFTGTWNAQGYIGDECKYLAQTFTAGITGNLTGVNIEVQTFSTLSQKLRVVIRSVTTKGMPTGTPLAVRYVTINPFIHLTRLIAFKTPIPVTTGAGYAIQVNVAGAIPQSGGLGVWGGTVGDLYTGGSVMTGDCGGGSYWRVLSNFDLHFCTYVDPA